MDEWMDGWMDGWIDVWAGRWMNQSIKLGPFSSPLKSCSISFPSQNCYLLSELLSNQATNQDVDLTSSYFEHVLDHRSWDIHSQQISLALFWLFGNWVICMLSLCADHVFPLFDHLYYCCNTSYNCINFRGCWRVWCGSHLKKSSRESPFWIFPRQ